MKENEAKEAAAEAKPVAYEISVFGVNAESGEREREQHTYFVPDWNFPKDVIDLGEYLKHGDGVISIITDDGAWVSSDTEDICPLCDGFCDNWDKFCQNLKPGEWAEWADGKMTYRVTAMSEYPKISVEKTRASSDLCPMQEVCVKIYGMPMFAVGDVWQKTVYRPRIAEDIDAIYTAWAVTHGATGVKVHVDEHDVSADRLQKHLRIDAPSKDAMASALTAFGVNDPAAVKVDCTFGDASGETGYTTSLCLTNIVGD